MFQNRRDAGQRLGRKLLGYAAERPLVLALPRGGVPVGYEVALLLEAPLDILLVRKLGVPAHREVAMGAVASGDVVILDQATIQNLEVSMADVEQIIADEREELRRREVAYRAGLPPIAVAGRTTLVVDDGLATGSTMLAAVAAIRKQAPRKIIVAVPIASEDACSNLSAVADEVICVESPVPFLAVGLWYQDFSQVSDQEVRVLLTASRDAAEKSLEERQGKRRPW